MRINNNSNIRAQIILIGAVGSIIFAGYIIFSMYSFWHLKRDVQDVGDIQYGVIQKLLALRHETTIIKIALADAVGYGDEIFLDDTDDLSEQFHRIVTSIVKQDMSLSLEMFAIDHEFTRYYSSARLLTLNLMDGSRELMEFQDLAISTNQNFSALNGRIDALVEYRQKHTLSTLDNIGETIEDTVGIGMGLGIITIAAICFITLLVSANVMRLINRSDQLKKDFLSTMSHELRTPMNGISGSIELLSGTDLDEDQHVLVEAANESFTAMKVTVDDILTFTDLISEAQSLKEEFFNLYESLQPLLSETKSRCETKEIELIVKTDGISDFLVKSDKSKILDVVRHLLNNAVKFTSAGSITFQIEQLKSKSKSKSEDARRHFTITVLDSGDGVPENMINEVFKPFRQIDGSFRRIHQGMGLGLAMCKSISDCMQGSISLNNRMDRSGAIVCFTFPAQCSYTTQKTVANEPTESNMPAVNSELANPGNKSVAVNNSNASEVEVGVEKRTILVVEDNNVNQMIIKGLLKRLGFKVILADNGLEALDKLPNSGAELVLMDLQMPLMDGFESTKGIRQLGDPYCDIPIIAVTANTMEGDKEHCLEVGMNDYLKKPINIDALQQAITAHLGSVT